VNFPTIGAVEMWAFLQALARVSTLIAVAPVFGSRQIPAQVKAALSVIIALTVTPYELPIARAEGAPSTLYGFAAGLIGNAVIGIILGYVASLIITSVELAGAFLDVEGGFTMAQSFNPAIGEMSAPLTQFHSMYAMLLFILAHGHYVLITTLAHSFSALPVSSVHYGAVSFFNMITDMTFQVLVSGLKIAAPAAAILFVVDISFALIARAAPQMNVFFVGMPIKAIAAFIMVILILPFVASLTGQLVMELPVGMQHAMEAIRR